MENRLTSVNYNAGQAYENYAYDESNRRIEKNDGPKVSGNAYDNDNLYFYGPDGKLLSIVAFT